MYEPPRRSTRGEAVLRRADECKLPEHLRLGLTIAAMEEHVNSLPADAVDRCNAAIPTNARGEPKFPRNAELNGYVNQFMIKQEDGGNTSVCERLLRQDSKHVGIATIFVSWALSASMHTLLDAIKQYLAQHPELPRSTKFWVCDFVVRQGKDDLSNLTDFANCLSVVGHTVLLLEPWYAPEPLKRTWCVFEVFHTQLFDVSGMRFDVVMSSAQQASFEAALVNDLPSIFTAVSAVDVRECTCSQEKETRKLLNQIEKHVGSVECNQRVVGLLNDALVAQGRAALERLPTAERATSVLINNLGELLHEKGDYKAAETLYRQALHARRETFGDQHPDTLTSINSLGRLLKDTGEYEEAEVLLREAMHARREMYRHRHPETLTSISNLGTLLHAKGDNEAAETLYRETLQARRETLGDQHSDTLTSINNLGTLLQDKGDGEAAEALYREALQASRETLGNRHQKTLTSINNLGKLLHARGDYKAAETLYRQALHTRRETLGNQHLDTLTSISNLGRLLKDKGKYKAAEVLLREAMHASRETLGNRHLNTLTLMFDLCLVLHKRGIESEAKAWCAAAVRISLTILGETHACTRAFLNNPWGIRDASAAAVYVAVDEHGLPIQC